MYASYTAHMLAIILLDKEPFMPICLNPAQHLRLLERSSYSATSMQELAMSPATMPLMTTGRSSLNFYALPSRMAKTELIGAY
jgi:hypothetical protein